MSTHAARWALSVLAVIGLGAFGLVDREFDANNPLFFLGLTFIVVTAVAAHAVTNAARHYTLNDEFETGYRVGFRAGRRSGLRSVKVADLPVVTPMRRKRAENESWLDTGDSRPGSTKQP